MSTSTSFPILPPGDGRCHGWQLDLVLHFFTVPAAVVLKLSHEAELLVMQEKPKK